MIKTTEKDRRLQGLGYTPAYFITCMEKNGTMKDKHGFDDLGSMRTFGFYYDLKDAREALNVNNCDMHEALYDYAIIEKMYPGIHPLCYDEGDFEWYKYDHERQGFFIDNELFSSGNFALG